MGRRAGFPGSRWDPAGKGSAALSWAGHPASGEALAERECPSLGFKCPPLSFQSAEMCEEVKLTETTVVAEEEPEPRGEGSAGRSIQNTRAQDE